MATKTTHHCDWCDAPVPCYEDKGADASLALVFGRKEEVITSDMKGTWSPHYAAMVTVQPLQRGSATRIDKICPTCLNALKALQEGKYKRMGEPGNEDET